MNYELNLENVQRFIDDPAVPGEGNGGLIFHIGDFEITIRKPYMDDDGTKMGNCIFCYNYDGIAISTVIVGEELLIHFKEIGAADFQQWNSASPAHIATLIRELWNGVVKKMRGW